MVAREQRFRLLQRGAGTVGQAFPAVYRAALLILHQIDARAVAAVAGGKQFDARFIEQGQPFPQ